VIAGTLVGSSAVACTLLNSLDDVKPQILATNTPEAGTPVTQDSGNNNTTTDAGDSGSVPQPNDKGAIVMGGGAVVDGGRTNVLTALDPTSGAELPKARETMNVAAVRYDLLRDIWYVFESGGVGNFPLPTDPVFLHVRTLDTITGTWTKRDTLKIPPIVSFTDVVVLNNRLVYVAYRDNGAVDDAGRATQYDLIMVDTSNPDSIKLSPAVQLANRPVGFLGQPSTTQTGGGINVLFTGPCSDDSNDGAPATCLNSQHYIVPADGVPTPSVSVLLPGTFFGTPAYGSYFSQSVDLVAYKHKFTDSQSVDIRSIQTTNNSVLPSTNKVGVNDPFLKPMAVDECRGYAILCGTNQDLAVYAVPLSTSELAAQNVSTDHSGQGVYFEPYTSTILAPFSQGSGFQLTAITVSGTPTAPILTKRKAPGWVPPADIAPEIVATKTPLDFDCSKFAAQ
jgi:hypothetical protein